jgi:hypothetical protein
MWEKNLAQTTPISAQMDIAMIHNRERNRTKALSSHAVKPFFLNVALIFHATVQADYVGTGIAIFRRS